MSENLDKLSANYKNPPIKTRTFEVTANLGRDAFEALAPGWLSDVSQQYPKQELRDIWKLYIRKNEKDTPIPKAVLTTVPRLYETASNGRISRAIELFPPDTNDIARFMFLQERPTAQVTRFAQLRAEVEKWLPNLRNHFNIKTFRNVKLTYHNEISEKNYPDFWKEGLRLDVILNFFAKNSAPVGGKLRPPFHAEVNVEIDPAIPSFIRTEMKGGEQVSTFFIDFEFSTKRRDSNESVESCLKTMDAAHALILEYFEKHFTESALRKFKE